MSHRQEQLHVFLTVFAAVAFSIKFASAAIVDGKNWSTSASLTYPQDFLQVRDVGQVVTLRNFRCDGNSSGFAIDIAKFSRCIPKSSLALTFRDATFTNLAALVLTGELALGKTLTVTVTNVILTNALLLLRGLSTSLLHSSAASSGLFIVLTHVVVVSNQSVALRIPPPALQDPWDSLSDVIAPVIVYNVTAQVIVILDSTFSCTSSTPVAALSVIYFPYPLVLLNGAVFLISNSSIVALYSANSGCNQVHTIRHSAPVVVGNASTYAIAHSHLTASTTCGWAAGQVVRNPSGRHLDGSAASRGISTDAAVTITNQSVFMWVNCSVNITGLGYDSSAQYFTSYGVNSNSVVDINGGSLMLWIACGVVVTSDSFKAAGLRVDPGDAFRGLVVDGVGSKLGIVGGNTVAMRGATTALLLLQQESFVQNNASLIFSELGAQAYTSSSWTYRSDAPLLDTDNSVKLHFLQSSIMTVRCVESNGQFAKPRREQLPAGVE